MSTDRFTTPFERPRRLRTTPAMRKMVRETRVHPSQLVLPAFIRDGIDSPVEISSMPGQYQHTEKSLRELARRCVDAGIGGIDLFGVPLEEDKDPQGSVAWAKDGVLNRGLQAVRDEVETPSSSLPTRAWMSLQATGTAVSSLMKERWTMTPR